MNGYCLLCHRRYERRIGWSDLFSFKPPDPLCDECRGSFRLIDGDVCEACGRPFACVEPSYRHGTRCIDCIRWEEDEAWRGVLAKNRSVYVYNAFLQEVIARWKFRGDYALAEAFRADVRREFFRHFSPDALLVPIPLSEERLYERAFNQAEALARLLELPMADVLERSDSEKQSKKSRRERLELDGVFRLRTGVRFDRHASLVLVDDIYTTGTTVRHAAKLLRQAGAADVSSFTLARA